MRPGNRRNLFIMAAWLFLFSCIPFISSSQYILNGNATQNTCNCYLLTQPAYQQSGSVWNSVKINLNNPFDFSFNVYLGCLDSTGADGIVFMLQPLSTNLGTSGGGMGFDGITPSIGVTLDTWQNSGYNDPYYDHISIQVNGNPTHGTDLAGPVTAANGNNNIEDCQWHIFRISWDPGTKWLRAYFDGSLRVEAQVDLIANIFNNDPMVYWGFSAATGGAYNLQQFCTALNPAFTTNFTNNTSCDAGNGISFLDQSVSFAPIRSWYWNFGNGNTSSLQNPPQQFYPAPGIYEVKLVITGFDGCVSDTLKKNIIIGSKPVAGFEVFDTCFRQTPRITDFSTNTVGAINQWTWLLDGSVVSGSQQPQLTNLTAGTHQLKLVVRSVYGCESDTLTKSFTIKPIPVIDAIVMDGCANQPIRFDAIQVDNATTIIKWNWNFGDGQSSTQQNTFHSYSQEGIRNIILTAMDNNGCISDPVTKTINIASLIVNAGNDTMVIKNIPFGIPVTYHWSGNPNLTVNWSPPTGLDNPSALFPIATLQDDITYILSVSSIEGCTDSDTITIMVFKGSAIYVPTAFTPNKDGLNDILKPHYIGIKKLDYFRVYNRWGQLVFSTNNTGAGWDGNINGISQATGTFIWMLKAEDITGKIYELKGTSTIIR